MKITERKLRKIIRSVIKEVRASDDEKFLMINPEQKEFGLIHGPDPIEMDIADLVRFGNHYPYSMSNILTSDSKDRIVQLFKAWCNKKENDVGGKGPRKILDLFFVDYPELYEIIDEDYHAQYRDLSGVRNLKKYPPAWDQMFAHAKKCGSLKL